MNQIQMVDLQQQYLRIKNEIDTALQQVIDKTTFINGPEVKLFAQELAEFVGTKHVIPCANGTDALQIAIDALNLPEGSEVIVPSFNYVAAVEVIAFMGLKPVFVDSKSDDFNIDVSQIEEKISPRTKAIIAVHLFGQCCEMDKIMEIAQKHNLYVIEDTAQSIAAQYTTSKGERHSAGTIGHIGTTSFFPSKNLACMGDGGAIFTNDTVLAQKMQVIANHGQKEKYYYDSVGINSRLDTLQAAVLRVKLRYLNQYIASRNQAADYYDRAFAGKIITPHRFAQSTHVFHQYTLLFENEAQREKVKQQLAKNSIPSMIYYPKPLHLQNAYLHFGFAKGSLPVAESLCERVLSLPMHTELDEEQLERITKSVLEAI
jgi:UDP-2-acetamido-2-deoxy-ribo-hexuluronate aminotransferase